MVALHLVLYLTVCTVKPDATAEEISAVVEDSEGGSQVFSQAVRHSFSFPTCSFSDDHHDSFRGPKNMVLPVWHTGKLKIAKGTLRKSSALLRS